MKHNVPKRYVHHFLSICFRTCERDCFVIFLITIEVCCPCWPWTDFRNALSLEDLVDFNDVLEFYCKGLKLKKKISEVIFHFAFLKN